MKKTWPCFIATLLLASSAWAGLDTFSDTFDSGYVPGSLDGQNGWVRFSDWSLDWGADRGRDGSGGVHSTNRSVDTSGYYGRDRKPHGMPLDEAVHGEPGMYLRAEADVYIGVETPEPGVAMKASEASLYLHNGLTAAETTRYIAVGAADNWGGWSSSGNRFLCWYGDENGFSDWIYYSEHGVMPTSAWYKIGLEWQPTLGTVQAWGADAEGQTLWQTNFTVNFSHPEVLTNVLIRVRQDKEGKPAALDNVHVRNGFRRGTHVRVF